MQKMLSGLLIQITILITREWVEKYFSRLAGVVVTLFIISFGSPNSAAAQNSQSKQHDQLQPLRSGLRLYGFTGSLRWQTHYFQVASAKRGVFFEKNSQTTIQVQFRNLYLLNSHIGLGYQTFTTIFMEGFFKGAGLGGVGGGPIARVYPLKSTRWQPFLQGNFVAGYNLALSDASGINDVGGVRYRSGLRGGLDYKISNGFGLFFEIGPEWEYDSSLQLDAHALKINLGIELFRF